MIVLGMHRSGTSAITRGLQVLGVDLGESLMPAASGNNEKGFFEDADIVSLNDRILGQAGRSWSSLESIPAEMLTGPEYFDLRAEATAMLVAKLRSRQRLGLKDPRLCMLMPFWKCVLDDLDVDVSFVIALRNPLAVARSLRARDGIVIEKGVALWGQHMLSAARATAGHQRVFVSFDHLMNNAVGELQRIAEKLDLPFPGVDSPEIQDYETNFLEDGLRHQLISDRELRRSGRASEIVADLFEKLLAMAEPAAPGRLPNKDLDIEDLIHRFADLPPLFRAIDTLEGALAKASANAAHQAGLAAEHERIRDIVQKAHDDACNQRDAALAQCEILSAEISILKVQLDQQVARTAEMDRERNVTQKAHDDACNQRDAALAQHQTLSAEVSALKAQLDHQIAVEAELVRIRDTLKQAHDDACTQRDALAAQLKQEASLVAEINRIRDEVQQAHDEACMQRDAALAGYNALSEEIGSLKEQMKQEQEALERQAQAIRAERDSAEQFQRAEKSRADRLTVLADQQAASVQHLQQALERAQAESLAYKRSTSWKLTAPLRGLSRILKPGRPPGRSLPEARSPATTSSKVWKLTVSNTAAESPLPPPARRPQIADQRGAAPRGSEWLAVAVHAFYPEILDEILSRLATSSVPLKLYVTAPAEAVADVAAKLRASDWPFILLNTDNRGRDAAPFIASLSAMRNDNATLILKLHTKRSPHLPDGNHWRTVLYDQLLLAGGPEQAISAFAENPDLGVLAPAGHILSTAEFMGTNAGNVGRVSENLGISQDMVLKSAFVAGSMFYARMDIFAGLDETNFPADQFEVERGQIDGTLAHAIERMTGLLAERRGLRMAFLNDPAGTPRPLGLGAFPYV
ncbi:MAG: hypothetical protein B7X55_07630 [Rhodobacterales bacterium 34-62-10]|nr:MAG: hypothetical protein B7X55_07630 [Rhodobacterales bacterium 34-62-10]